MEGVINYDNLDSFCEKNGLLIISKEELDKEKMYVDLKYANDDNFVGRRVYPKDMPLIINKIVWEKVKKINTPVVMLIPVLTAGILAVVLGIFPNSLIFVIEQIAAGLL